MYEYNYYYNSYSELYHFGTIGMKWGIRRYQNSDGSLTPEGYVHYGRKSKRLGKKESHLSKAEDYGRNQTGYEFETRKAVSPLVGLGIGGFVGTAMLSEGYALTEAVLPALSATAGGAAGYVAASAAVLVGQQIVNKLLMHQHEKISAKKKTIDQKLSQYESSQKKKKLTHSDIDELMHFGILGMKWGVRRYQNPDGTLTAEGKKRYSSGVSQHYIDKNNFMSAMGNFLKLNADLGDDYASGPLTSNDNHRFIADIEIPDDCAAQETIQLFKNKVSQAKKDVAAINNTSFKFKEHDLGAYGTPVFRNEVHAIIDRDTNHYSRDVYDDYDGEYLGNYEIEKHKNGWKLGGFID